MKNLMSFALLFCFYFPATCSGELFQLGDVYMHGKFFSRGSRNLMITQNVPNQSLTKELNLQVDTVILDYVYWNHKIHSQVDNRQFRVIGWDFQIGITLLQGIDLEYGHFSKHWLDFNTSVEFPVEDYFGFKFYFNQLHKPQHKPIIGGQH